MSGIMMEVVVSQSKWPERVTQAEEILQVGEASDSMESIDMPGIRDHRDQRKVHNVRNFKYFIQS
jgi:hypothetical protein